MKKLNPVLKKQIQKFQKARTEELAEAKQWILNGNPDTPWHWKEASEQTASLETSFEYFLVKYSNPEEHTEENIVRFCGQEVHDLWNGYPDDNITSRQNHCAALYAFIKSKLK